MASRGHLVEIGPTTKGDTTKSSIELKGTIKANTLKKNAETENRKSSRFKGLCSQLQDFLNIFGRKLVDPTSTKSEGDNSEVRFAVVSNKQRIVEAATRILGVVTT